MIEDHSSQALNMSPIRGIWPRLLRVWCCGIGVLIGLSLLGACDDFSDPIPASFVEEVDDRERRPELYAPESRQDIAPELFRVYIETTKGRIVLRCRRDLAPRSAERFYYLCRFGFYDNQAFYRVIRNELTQFGIHNRPRLTRAWRAFPLDPDPVRASNATGTIAMALDHESGQRTTQFFINGRNNVHLDQAGFAPFGAIEEGLDVFHSLNADFNDIFEIGNPRGVSAKEFARLGRRYLSRKHRLLDRILKVRVQELKQK